MTESGDRLRDYFESAQIVRNPMIDEYVRVMVVAQNSLLEEKITEAIQGGICGVLLKRKKIWDFNNNEIKIYVSCEIDSSVPYGQVYEVLEEN